MKTSKFWQKTFHQNKLHKLEIKIFSIYKIRIRYFIISQTKSKVALSFQGLLIPEPLNNTIFYDRSKMENTYDINQGNK